MGTSTERVLECLHSSPRLQYLLYQTVLVQLHLCLLSFSTCCLSLCSLATCILSFCISSLVNRSWNKRIWTLSNVPHYCATITYIVTYWFSSPSFIRCVFYQRPKIVPGIILMRTVSCYVAVNFKFCEVAFLFNLHYNNGILIYNIVNKCAPFVLLYTICVEMTVTALHFTCWMKTRMKYLRCSTRTTCCPEQMILSSRKTSLKYVYVHSYSCLHYTDCFWSRTELFILIFFHTLCRE